MKKALLFVLIFSGLTSCSEQPSVPATKNMLDIITVTDNGTTYSDTIMMSNDAGGKILTADSVNNMDQNMILHCTLQKSGDKTFFTVNYYNPSPEFPLSLTIFKAESPADGIGTYKAYGPNPGVRSSSTDIDSSLFLYESKFSEYFIGGKKYTVDSAVVTITKISGNIEGNFRMWLAHTTENKTVTGTIIWKIRGANWYKYY